MFISSIKWKDLKKPIHSPAHRLEEIRTEVDESGQKRRIKTLGVNRNVSLVYICDPIDQNTS